MSSHLCCLVLAEKQSRWLRFFLVLIAIWLLFQRLLLNLNVKYSLIKIQKASGEWSHFFVPVCWFGLSNWLSVSDIIIVFFSKYKLSPLSEIFESSPWYSAFYLVLSVHKILPELCFQILPFLSCRMKAVVFAPTTCIILLL